jgi:beta-glucosidase
VTVPLGRRAFSYWSSAKQDWVEARGCYGVHVGESSRSLPLQRTIGISGEGKKRKAPRCRRA